MLITLLILSLLSILLIWISKSKELVELISLIFFIAQLSFAVWGMFNIGIQEYSYLDFDTLGVSFWVLMSVIGLLSTWRSVSYLDTETARQSKIYYSSFIALNIALTGVYLSNNLALTWIFLEGTTIAAAFLIYHRRTIRSLEATWKYLFVSSVGLAIAYLGILLLVASMSVHSSLDYYDLTKTIAQGNMLYIKLAFVFIIVGYSAKMEIFPLYTVGIDANHSAPTPASAFISTAMVGGGFVALFRLYRVLSYNSEVFVWVKGVLLIVGFLSLLVAAVYMGRTSNYKRLFAYSTVENGGLVVLGLGVGGLGVWAAVLHILAHTIIKAFMFLQLSVAGRVYNTYKVGRIGGYFAVDKPGSLVIIGGLIALVALPPSLLFRSEYLILSELIKTEKWWIVIPMFVLLLVVIFWFSMKVLPILFKPQGVSKIYRENTMPVMSYILIALMLIIFSSGIWLAPELIGLINSIVNT